MIPWTALLLACAGGGAPASAEAPPPTALPPEVKAAPEAAAPAEDPARRFVIASRLNLRAGPDQKAELRGRLEINSPVEVLEELGDFARVRAGNGKEGWVRAEFLGASAVDRAAAIAALEQSESGSERLAWAQRAAAIAPNDDRVLELLAAAYRAEGKTQEADRVERRRSWPDDLKLAGAFQEGGVWLELITSGDPGMERFGGPLTPEQWQGLPRALSEADLEALGVELGQSWWVLPTEGPAVQATVSGGHFDEMNPCGGTLGVRLSFDAALPEGQTALAFSRSAPPDSWSQPRPAVSEADRASVEEAARARAIGDHGRDKPVARAVRSGEGWFVRVAEELPKDEDMGRWFLADYRTAPGGALVEVELWPEFNSYTGYEVPSFSRDLDGDGRLDVLWVDSCSMRVEDPDGAVRAQTTGLCCGC